jgi:hypothetical protein
MANSDKQTVENLRNGNGKRQNRSQSSGKSGAAKINNQIDDAAQRLADAMKKQIGAKALNILQNDLQNGDLGDFFTQGFEQCLDSMTDTIEAEYFAIEEGNSDPKSLPYAS